MSLRTQQSLRSRLRSHAPRALLEWRAARKPDAELVNLRGLVEAYSAAQPPEILLTGDSSLLFHNPAESDSRPIAQMISDELHPGQSVHPVAGSMYNPRIVTAFLEALSTCPRQPKVVVLPAALVSCMTLVSSHPRLGYDLLAPELVRRARERDWSIHPLPRASHEMWEDWDCRPTPSLFGARRTAGEVRLLWDTPLPLTSSPDPTTRWQQVVRLKHILDFNNAEELTPESPGVVLLQEMAARVVELGIPSVACIPPINHTALKSYFGEPAVERLARNTEVIASAYAASAGPAHRIVDATFDSGADEFGDPVHLAAAGRLRFARRICEAVGELT